MRRWALVVIALYGLLLVAVTLPGIVAALAPLVKLSEAAHILLWPPYWIWLGALLLAQAGLLATPVRIARRRPVTRQSLWLPVTATGFLAGLLAAGASFSLAELWLGEAAAKGAPGPWPLVLATAGAALLLVWAGWALVFHWLAQSTAPQDFVSRQCRLLLKGSVLELLIAVPTHIIARYRDYCCAGFLTFLGLAFGLCVMAFSFGPAVFFLYADRWRKLHPSPPGT